MPRTPDRRPGAQLEDDSILFEDRVSDIDSAERGLYRKGQSLYGRDSVGVFNLRSGSGGLIIEIATIEISISSGKNKPYFEITDSGWSVIAYIDFPGTDEFGTPTDVHAIAWQKSAGTPGMELRLINAGNNDQLAYVSGITNTEPQRIEFGSLANWPTSHAIVQVQALKGQSTGNVANISLERT